MLLTEYRGCYAEASRLMCVSTTAGCTGRICDQAPARGLVSSPSLRACYVMPGTDVATEY
eukprot:160092-Rhodomonas_salina.2